MNRLAPYLAGSVLLNVILLVLLVRGCGVPNCPETVIIKHTIDTIRPDIDTITPQIVTSVPKPRNINKRSEPIAAAQDSFSCVSGFHEAGGAMSATSSCFDEVSYSDTTEVKDSYRAIINEVVQDNRIKSRELVFYNLTPRIVETIEKIQPQRERVRVYAGFFAGVQGSYTRKQITGWSAGPELMLTMPVGAAVGYGYDARNNGHQLHFLYKIKLRK